MEEVEIIKKIVMAFLVATLVFAVLAWYAWATVPFEFEGMKAGVVCTVNFADGSTQTYGSTELSLLPLTITDTSGKEISSIEVAFLARLEVTGQVSQWSVAGKQHCEVYKKPETVPRESSTYTFSESGSTWTSGETKQLSLVTVTSSQIEGAIEQHGTGEWFWQITGLMSVDVTFADGTTEEAEATAPAVGLTFIYTTGGIESFTISIKNVALSLDPITGQLASLGLPTWTIHVVLVALALIFGALTCYCYLKAE